MRRTLLAGLTLIALRLDAQVLDKAAVLGRQTWWDNRDAAWFAQRIPMFESPDTAIDATYYYRWELVTKHLTYGAPETGYTLTEFIDRPFWSGAYGAISCPLGHQLDEIRWLKDRRIVDDFAAYWFETPGAQPRSYSNWYGAAVWGAYEVLGDTAFLRRMLPHMKAQYAGWMSERWDAAHRMFKWDGLHDGMERSITSRQTDDIDEGAVGFRPTLNTYLYADALAIAKAAALFGDSATAREFRARADDLRRRVHVELWDERRQFFLHQFANDEKDGVKALSRTYDTGKYAGSPYGRELLGYVPWQFHLPEPGKGYERAWRFLMDTAHFRALYGPTTAERRDPQFHVSPRCCWWSGNSWPYATTQTLTALANVVRDYPQDVVSAADWMAVFETYTRTHRKAGRPYVAEAAHPDNGSWDGHDTPWHSEHYFHSAYTNLVITGLAGLRPRADDSVEVHPLAPASWPYFALDDVSYHGHRISVLWDRDGIRYGRGRGLMIVVDGEIIARAPTLGRLVAHLGPPRFSAPAPRPMNVAVNNGRGAWPWVDASWSAPENPPTFLVDGNYWYHEAPANRWTNVGSRNARDTVTLSLGTARTVDRVSLYFLEDSVATGTPGRRVLPPMRYELEAWLDGAWTRVRGQRRVPARPEGRRANVVSFPAIATGRVRVILGPRAGAWTGMSELEAWSPVTLPLTPASDAPVNLAFNDTREGTPAVSASFTGQRDRVTQVNDGVVAFTRYSRNRWTAFGSPNASDWVAVDLGTPKRVSTVELYVYDDGGGVKAPRRYDVQYWDGTGWRDVSERSRHPARPMGSARNVVRLTPVMTSRVRVIFEHALPAFTGVTEIVVR